MSRRGAIVGIAALAAASILAVWLYPRASGLGDTSSLSRAAPGWLAARRYLEARGVETSLLDRPELPAGGSTHVTCFPWRVSSWRESLDEIDRHLDEGGRLVVGYEHRQLETLQRIVLRRLDLGWRDLESAAPLSPFEFFEADQEEWTLEPGAEAGWRGVRLRVPRMVVSAPKGARTLYRGPEGDPVVFDFPRGDGRVLVMPAELLANARLSEPGHVDLLEMLRLWGGDGRWSFDEYHHGLVAPIDEVGRRGRGAVDAFVVHMLLLYGFALWTLVRRFGPARERVPVIVGSTDRFLRGVGRLHDGLGHHAAAARLLVRRAVELSPGLKLPRGLLEEAEGADGRRLLAIARAVARAQERVRGRS